MASDLRPDLGRLGERLAREHLQRLGYEIVDRNFRTRAGELDIVARRGDTLVFVEVKTRRGGGAPLDAVGEHKRERVRSMARAYLLATPGRPWAPELRFDAIGVRIDGRGRLLELEHLEAAF